MAVREKVTGRQSWMMCKANGAPRRIYNKVDRDAMAAVGKWWQEGRGQMCTDGKRWLERQWWAKDSGGWRAKVAGGQRWQGGQRIAKGKGERKTKVNGGQRCSCRTNVFGRLR
jgi:hypothetical protein